MAQLGTVPGQAPKNASKPSMAQPGTVPEQAPKNASKPSMARPGTMAKLGTVPGQAPAADHGSRGAWHLGETPSADGERGFFAQPGTVPE